MKLARDPVCGTFVVPGKALEFVRGQRDAVFLLGRLSPAIT